MINVLATAITVANLEQFIDWSQFFRAFLLFVLRVNRNQLLLTVLNYQYLTNCKA